jgi:hypothetical protein
MTDDDFRDLSADEHRRTRRLRARAMIRANNHQQPRCSGCGSAMLLFMPSDVLTDAQCAGPDYNYLTALDYRPGDMICFECWFAMLADDNGRTGFVWGHA